MIQVRKILTNLSPALKSSFDNFFRIMVGELRVGGMSGYLGKYATCAIETEETGHNYEGHQKSLAVQSAIYSLNADISQLGSGENRIYGTNEEHHWNQAIKCFIEQKEPIEKFLSEEESYSEKGKNFNDVVEAYREFEKVAFDHMNQACDTILAENSNSIKFSQYKAALHRSTDLIPQEGKKLSNSQQQLSTVSTSSLNY